MGKREREPGIREQEKMAVKGHGGRRQELPIIQGEGPTGIGWAEEVMRREVSITDRPIVAKR